MLLGLAAREGRRCKHQAHLAGEGVKEARYRRVYFVDSRCWILRFGVWEEGPEECLG